MPSPQEVVAQSAPGQSVIGWKLDREHRRVLLERFPPRFAQAVADHVTLRARVAADACLPDAADGEIVGRADDGRGIEAMVVKIGGSTDRPGGGTYHISWSLAAGRQAKESNDLLAGGKWEPIAEPVAVALTPARIK